MCRPRRDSRVGTLTNRHRASGATATGPRDKVGLVPTGASLGVWSVDECPSVCGLVPHQASAYICHQRRRAQSGKTRKVFAAM